MPRFWSSLEVFNGELDRALMLVPLTLHDTRNRETMIKALLTVETKMAYLRETVMTGAFPDLDDPMQGEEEEGEIRHAAMEDDDV